MSYLLKLIQFTINIFRHHKLKVVCGLLSFLVFLFLLFPFSDLSDLVSAQIAEATQGQVYIQFEKMGLGLIPRPSVSLKDTTIITRQLPIQDLHVGRFSFSPSLFELISF